MYAFRKPFSAAGYGEHQLVIEIAGRPLEAKTVFVISQILGYCTSKYLGAKLCSEVRREHLGPALLVAIGCALAALLAFAVVPPGLKVVAIFLNGLPLGFVWGLMVRYLEGRRISELLLAAVSCSFILASGEVKRFGLSLMERGVPEYWMPFVTGAVYLAPFVVSVGLLSLIPKPDAADEALRSKRSTMGREDRRAFLRRFFPGLLPLFIAYFFLTAFRDFRDNYQSDLFHEMGIADPAAFSRTERPIALSVMVVLALIFLIRNNRAGLMATYGIVLGGLALMGGATWAWDHGMIDGEMWMIGNGLGAYLAYVPFGTVMFDRMIALTRFGGTAVFAIYVADSLGYTGSVGVQLYKDLFAENTERLEYFRCLTYGMSLGGLPLMALAMIYFLRQGPASERSAGKD
ncbi:hypothetical protein Hsar01_01263 [Haloferula sargassicola]|uniref:MFS transporter n=2 Tax=Haloferula sargassicola TaxID=490096 RepID=A0ABP9UKB9_9BACT